MECVPVELAKNITVESKVPVIGIGAGQDVDGQILVLYDAIDIAPGKRTRFSKNFMEQEGSIRGALEAYVQEVKSEFFHQKNTALIRSLKIKIIMGRLIDKYKKMDPDFKFEFNSYLQELKSQNELEKNGLYETINSLRQQFEELNYKKNREIQKVLSDKNGEITNLKASITELREVLEHTTFDARDSIQRVTQSYEDQLKQLKALASHLEQNWKTLNMRKIVLFKNYFPVHRMK